MLSCRNKLWNPTDINKVYLLLSQISWCLRQFSSILQPPHVGDVSSTTATARGWSKMAAKDPKLTYSHRHIKSMTMYGIIPIVKELNTG